MANRTEIWVDFSASGGTESNVDCSKGRGIGRNLVMDEGPKNCSHDMLTLLQQRYNRS